MRITFLGATHEVTGSCTYLEACGKHILIDCGMEQGPDEFENQEIPVAASDIDMVLLTHAHIDHSGKLPLLYQRGFRGQIFATRATADLCDIMLRDSAHIQMFEAEWKNRKGQRAGRQKLCHCMISTMHRERSTVLLDAIMTKKSTLQMESAFGLWMQAICLALLPSRSGSKRTMWRKRLYFPGISAI